jgi:NTP pyrophosphatase (non-canonical NTP hydrolase)
MSNDLALLTRKLLEFRDERNWEQFHNPKDLAIAISAEAAELLEVFLWKTADEANVERVKEELADVFSFSLLLANRYGLDVAQIVLDKIEHNRKKYPVDLAKGNAKKYTDLTNGNL